MSLDFGVTDTIFLEALAEIKEIKLTDSHWQHVAEMLEQENVKANQNIESQRVTKTYYFNL